MLLEATGVQVPPLAPTSVQVSGDAGAGSHFSMAFAAKDDRACICAAENVVRVLVAETDALAATAPMPTNVAVVLADVDRMGCAAADALRNDNPLADAELTAPTAEVTSLILSAIPAADADDEALAEAGLIATTCADVDATGDTDADEGLSRAETAETEAEQGAEAEA